MAGFGTNRKLRPPGLGPWVVARPRLDALLIECFDRFDVVELAAAPGAGKTVAAQLFVARYGWPTAWLNLDRGDRSGTRLVVSLGRALAPYAPNAVADVEAAMRSGSTAYEAAAELAAGLDAETVLLVLDNCEQLDGAPEAGAVLTAVLQYLPAGVRVMLLSRESLDPLVARLGLDGRVARITDADLAFDVPETSVLLAAAGRTHADPAEVVEATGGWVAGIVFGVRPQEGRATGEMAAYLNHEILDRLPRDEQEFLLRTSLVATVTPRVATELCGPRGRALLAHVARRHLPATVGPDGAVQYHPFFREFLAEEFERRLPDESFDVHRRLAHLLAADGDFDDAVERLLAIGATDDAAAVAEQALDALRARGDWSLLLSWFERLGDERVHARPRLVGTKVRALGQVRRLPEARSLIRDLHARGLLGPVADCDPGVVAHIGWVFMADPLEGLAVTDAYPRDHEAEATRYVLRVMSGTEPAVPPPGRDFGEVQRFHTWGLFLQGRLDEVARWLPSTGPWAPSGRYRPFYSVLTLLWQGDLDGARKLWDELPLDLRERGHTDLWLNLDAWMLLGEGDAGAAMRVGQESVAYNFRTRFGWEHYLQLVVAAAAVRLGQVEHARSILDDVVTGSHAAGHLAYVEWAQAYRGAVDLLVGDHEAARTTLRDCIASMEAAGRRLVLPAALAYLSEAEARAGDGARAAETAALAERQAHESRSLFPYQQALVDFPSIAARTGGHRPAASAPPSTVAAAHHVEVRPFGRRPDVWIDGAPCGIGRLKVIELAAYLALHGGVVNRQQVQLDLFPEHDLRAGSNYFRQITHQFRRTTGLPVVRVEPDVVGVPSGAVLTSVDVLLEHLLVGAPVDRGSLDVWVTLLDRIEGPYLAASSLPWAEQRRFELQVLVAGALRGCAAVALAEGRLDLAERLAEKLLLEDPFSEHAFAVLGTVATKRGSPERYEIVYRRAQAALAEVGLQPEDVGLGLR